MLYFYWLYEWTKFYIRSLFLHEHVAGDGKDEISFEMKMEAAYGRKIVLGFIVLGYIVTYSAAAPALTWNWQWRLNNVKYASYTLKLEF